MNTARPPSASDPLEARVRREIAASGPMRFHRFMELALYDADGGYYARGAGVLGREGDYFTASDSGRDFGACVARQLREIDRTNGPWDPFDAVELGGGRGLLARDVIDALGDDPFARRLRYTLVDRSAAMREAATEAAPEARVRAPERLPRGCRGAVIAIELFDALPVHRLRRREGRLVELAVAIDSAGRLVESEVEPTPETRRYAERYGAAAEEGHEAEVAPAAPALLEQMAEALDAGVILIVDYGDRADALYGPRRPRGTLLAYHGHRTSEEYLERIGTQDLTAHVNFSALEDRARELGLDLLGLTTQDRFLIGNGLLELFEDQPIDALHDPRRAKRRLQAMQLIHPHAMGRAFKVLLLSKGLSPPPALSGLRDPFSRRS